MPNVDIESQAPARIHGERTITIKLNTRGAWWLVQCVEQSAGTDYMKKWPHTENFRDAFAKQLRSHLEGNE